MAKSGRLVMVLHSGDLMEQTRAKRTARPKAADAGIARDQSRQLMHLPVSLPSSVWGLPHQSYHDDLIR